MTAVATDVLLALAVLAAWLGCLGYARLRDAADRLHCTTFVAAAVGLPLVATAFLADGASSRAIKTGLIVLVSLGSGAALTHATGRMLKLRGDGESGR